MQPLMTIDISQPARRRCYFPLFLKDGNAFDSAEGGGGVIKDLP
jgi:hypothetical protein